MAYFIFLNNTESLEGTIYRIAETQSDLDNLNILKSNYKIITESTENFNSVKLGEKYPELNSDNTITFVSCISEINNKEEMQQEIDNKLYQIKNFLDSNSSHPAYTQWNNYYNQIKNLDLESIPYPLDKSFEKYLNDLGQTSLHTLQIP